MAGHVGGATMANLDGHDVHLRGRKQIEVTGVSSVESFDVTEFSLVTSGGPLSIKGTNLHMKHLDLDAGLVMIEGTVVSMDYVAEHQKNKKFTRRIFR